MITSPLHRLPRRALALATCALLLQACGGGSGDAGTPVATNPTVTGVTPDRLSYGRLSTFTITGTNLASSGVTFAATGCDGVAMVTGGSATQQQFTCTPNNALSVRLAARSGGAEFYSGPQQVVPKPQVTLTTTMGNIVIELEPAVVQLTVDNFLAYANAGFYNGTIFHRVERDFVVQGGGYTDVVGSSFTPQPGGRPPITLETNMGLSNLRGTIAMARTATANSATSEFFFNVVNNSGSLDYQNATVLQGYAVFGRIVSDLAVVDAINSVPTRELNPNFHIPITKVTLQTAAQTL